jgi:hypothetical protein
MSFWDLFGAAAKAKSEQLSWGWIDDNNIAGGTKTPPFIARQCYFMVRLSEMYIHDQRVLWKKFYPMVHGFIRHGKREFAEVAGPGQLKELGTGNLERLVGLAYPLTTPIVYTGEDIDLLVGLYAVPGQDAAKVLLASLGQLSSLAGISAEIGLKIADVVKTGVEGLMQMDGSTLQLGARDSLKKAPPPAVKAPTGKTAKAGYLLAVNAPDREMKAVFPELWVKEGRLVQGSNPMTADAYDGHDYMLIEVERRDTREDWRSLPLVQKYEEQFDAILRSDASIDDKKARITKLWDPFVTDIKASPDLTEIDMDRVTKGINDTLKVRIKPKDPFAEETRSAAGKKAGGALRKGFDLLDVQDAFADKTAAEIANLRVDAAKLNL